MANAMGFPTETHKLVKIKSIAKEGEKEHFTPIIMELNFGSKALFSSGAYMHCLECAKIKREGLLKCTEMFTACVERDFLISANKIYVDTVRYFGPRKCNCQSYVYYLLCILGVSKKKVLQNKVVETHCGYISETVKQLIYNVECERPTCDNDPNILKSHSEKLKIVQIIPTTLQQMELSEYNDKVGRRYLTLFGISLTLTNFLIWLVAVIFYWWIFQG